MARGFGATLGNSTNDVITSSLAAQNTQRTYSVHFYKNGDGGGSQGRIIDKPNYETFWYITSTIAFQRFHSSAHGRWTIAVPSSSAWHRMAWAYDSGATTNDPVIYLDGSSQTVTEALTPSGSANSNGSVVYGLGNAHDSLSRNWDGMIAEFAVWDRLLTAAELAAVTNGMSPLAFPASLVEYIPLVRDNVSHKRAAPTVSGTAIQPHPRVFYTGGHFFQHLSPAVNATIVGVAATASAAGLAGTVAAQNATTITGIAATAQADGFAGTVAAIGIVGVVGVVATATATGLAGTVAAQNTKAIVGVTATASASGLLGTVVAQNKKDIVGITATATASGNAGAVLIARTITGITATATASGNAGTVAAIQIVAVIGVTATASAAGQIGVVVAQNVKAIVGVTATATATGLLGSVLIGRTISGITATATADGLLGTVVAQNIKVISGITATATAAGNAGTVLAQIATTISGIVATATASGNAGTVIALLGRLVTHFRFRNDDGSETTATWAQAEDVDHAAAPGINVRLRIQMDTNIDTPSEAVTLQYDKSGDGAWKDLV